MSILPFRLAVAVWAARMPLNESVRLVSETGAQGIQIDARDQVPPASLGETGRREFLHRLDEQGLKVSSLNFPTRRTFYDDDALDHRVSATKAVMSFAHKLGASIVTVRVGHIPANVEGKEYRVLVEVLNDLARHGNHVGATIAITPKHDSPEALLALFSAVNSGPIGLDFDPASFLAAGHKPNDAFRELHQHITHVTGRDAIRNSDGSHPEVVVGRGEVDWVELMPLLESAGYRSWITALRMQGDDRFGDMLRCVKLFQEIVQQ